ncbi:MAG: hypothetical protein F7B61_02100 [Caldisphaeraceae archaeon]|nr:hypothetical protein [Caldisphaeraceae archaeon]
MIRKTLGVVLFAFLLIVAGCTSSAEHHFSDSRFDGQVTVENGSLYLTIAKAPFGATVKDITIEKYVGGDVGYEYLRDCNDVYPVKVGEKHKLSCFPDKPGKYLLRFTLYHTAGSDYKKVNGESCIVYKGGSQDCESYADLSFEVK